MPVCIRSPTYKHTFAAKKSEAKKKRKEMLLYNLNTHHKMSDKLKAFLWTGYQVRGHHGYEANHDHLNFVTANEAEVPTCRYSTIYFTNYKPFFFFLITLPRFWIKAVYQFWCKINRVNFYRSPQLCTWRNNSTKNKDVVTLALNSMSRQYNWLDCRCFSLAAQR